MKVYHLALLGCAFAASACQRDTGSDEMVANDLNADMAVDNATENMTAVAATDVDAAFVTEAMKGDNGEVAIGTLAATQATSQAAKDFGQMLAADHGGHKEKLTSLALGAGLPATDELSDEGQKNLDKLKTLQGVEFDKEFKRMMVEDHDKDIAKYEKQASSGDAQTSALAKETLPTLRKHLETARAL